LRLAGWRVRSEDASGPPPKWRPTPPAAAAAGCGRRATRLLERRATAHGCGVFQVQPFFRLRSGWPITVDKLRDWVKRLMQGIGLKPAHFGAHSLRIGGATALFAASADLHGMCTMGRWFSNCYASTCVRASARRSSGRSAPARLWLTTLLENVRRLMATKVSLTRRGSEAAAGLQPGSANYPSEGSYLGPAPSTVHRAARVQP